MTQERIHLDLQLDLSSEPITGELTVPGGRPTTFTGYTSLIVALDGIRVGSAGPSEATDRVSDEARLDAGGDR